MLNPRITTEYFFVNLPAILPNETALESRVTIFYFPGSALGLAPLAVGMRPRTEASTLA